MKRRQRRWRGWLGLATVWGLVIAWNAPPLYVPAPPVVLPSPNARDRFVEALELRVHMGEVCNALSGPPPPFDRPMVWADHHDFPEPATGGYSGLTLGEVVAANRPVLEKLREGLCLPYREPGPHGYERLYPELAKFRDLARICLLSSRRAAYDGDFEEALRCRLDSIQMGIMVPRGAPLIGICVGRALEGMQRVGLADLVEQPSAPAARRAARRVMGMHASRVPLPVMLTRDGQCACAALAEFLEHHAVSQRLRKYGLEWWSDGPCVLKVLYSRRAQVVSLRRYYDRLIAEAGQPYPVRVDPPPPGAALAALHAGARLSKLSFEQAELSSRTAMLAVALALRAYRLEHAEYPAQLAALAPEYLHHLPTDPFTDQRPLSYRLTPRSYLLYCVGPDGTDEGGRPIVRLWYGEQGRHLVEPDSRGDIVWGINE